MYISAIVVNYVIYSFQIFSVIVVNYYTIVRYNMLVQKHGFTVSTYKHLALLII
jgi:hypothetical protein